MNEEVMKVLAMLQEGQIDTEQAAQLIEALGATEAPARPTPPPTPEADTGPLNGKRKRRLRIVVTSPKGDNVNIKIPARLITAGVKVGKYFTKKSDVAETSWDTNGLDWDELGSAVKQMIEDNDEGEIMDIVSEKGENVKIWLE
ncbi:MAG: hypothetical protein GX153_05185 [Clostridiaceae bacterium]|nr:hypothetical protein [Clostridiaceae bacterium]